MGIVRNAGIKVGGLGDIDLGMRFGCEVWGAIWGEDLRQIFFVLRLGVGGIWGLGGFLGGAKCGATGWRDCGQASIPTHHHLLLIDPTTATQQTFQLKS